MMDTSGLPEGNWVQLPQPRIASLGAAQLGAGQKFLLAITRRQAKAKNNLNVFLLLARLGKIFPRYLLFLSHLLMKGRISRLDKERIILHVAWRLGCVYEWGHHVQMARDLGISNAEILSLASMQSPLWDHRLSSMLQAVDELIDSHQLSTQSWQALAAFWSAEQLVEFCMLVGHYIMVALTINASGIQLEDTGHTPA